MAGARTDPSPASVASLPSKSNFRDHPNAPTEFPKTWSTPEAPPPVKAFGDLRYIRLERRIPRPGHVNRGRRIPSRADPQKSDEILSQMPTIHRPQPPPKSEASRSSIVVFLAAPSRPSVTALPGSDRRSLPQLERAQDVQPLVKDPASTGVRLCHRDIGPIYCWRGSTSKETPRRVGGWFAVEDGLRILTVRSSTGRRGVSLWTVVRPLEGDRSIPVGTPDKFEQQGVRAPKIPPGTTTGRHPSVQRWGSQGGPVDCVECPPDGRSPQGRLPLFYISTGPCLVSCSRIHAK